MGCNSHQVNCQLKSFPQGATYNINNLHCCCCGNDNVQKGGIREICYGETGAPELISGTHVLFDLNVLRGDTTVITDANSIFTAPEDGIYSFYLKPQQYGGSKFAVSGAAPLVITNLELTTTTGERRFIYTESTDNCIMQTISWIGKLGKGDKLKPNIFSSINVAAEPMDKLLGGFFAVFQHTEI